MEGYLRMRKTWKKAAAILTAAGLLLTAERMLPMQALTADAAAHEAAAHGAFPGGECWGRV